MVRPAGMPLADMPRLGFFSRFCSVITAWVVSMMPAMEHALVRPLRVTCRGGGGGRGVRAGTGGEGGNREPCRGGCGGGRGGRRW